MFTPVWEFVEDRLTRNRIFSIEDVFLELEAQDDEIYAWAKNWKDNFIPLENDIQLAARTILAENPKILDFRRIKSSADPFLIAAAMVRGGTIVTEEKPSGGPGKQKIPDVARKVGIPCINFLQFLDQERFTT
jgi:hypothetical protein